MKMLQKLQSSHSKRVEVIYGNYVEWSAKFHQILNSCAFMHGFEIATNLTFFFAFHVKVIYFGEVMMKVDLFMHVTTGSEIVTMLLLFYRIFWTAYTIVYNKGKGKDFY